jgi:hypothetical protein
MRCKVVEAEGNAAHAQSTVPGLVAMALLLLAQGCSGPPLKPWHTEKLTEEFTAAKADEIQTFDDYRQLEDRLFTQLKNKVYARTDTGPATVPAAPPIPRTTSPTGTAASS